MMRWVVVVGAVVGPVLAQLPANWPAYLSNYAIPDGVPPERLRVAEIDGMPQVFIPAGEFTIGSTAEEQEWAWQQTRKIGATWVQRGWLTAEGPQKRLNMPGMWVDVHEVTNEQYCRYLNAVKPDEATRKGWVYLLGENDGDRKPPAGYLEPQIDLDNGTFKPVAGFEHHPVIWVTRGGGGSYANWAGRRLPTEAQWERAARGGQEGWRWPWGSEDQPPARVGNLCDESAAARVKDWHAASKYFAGYDDGYATTAPVGQFTPNGFGLLDMCGNVWEWCRDGFDEGFYAKMGDRDPVNEAGTPRQVLRGGSWTNAPWYLRLACRHGVEPRRYFNAGFRGVEAVE